jgi:hypothetical protein
MVFTVGAAEPVIFSLNGKEYRLRFTLSALKALDQNHQIKVMRAGDAMIDALRDPEKLALILYHGLLPNHPDVTVEWVEANFDLGMLLELAPVIGKAVSGKAAELPNADRPGSKPNGIGLLSGPSDDMTSGSPSPNSGA